jgi:uncharacterized repeat protein (TIGR03847 family)
MTGSSYDFDAPDHIVAGAVGAPGERTFYIQARQDGALVTLKSEKEQVRALGEYLAGVLEKLGGPTAKPAPDAALVEPLEPVWAVGSIGLGYDEEADRIIIAVSELVEEEGAEAATAQFAVTRAQAARIVEQARALMRGGRPACPMCSQPIDPGGHFCVRANGQPPGH